mgnify:CR=1 FL=1
MQILDCFLSGIFWPNTVLYFLLEFLENITVIGRNIESFLKEKEKRYTREKGERNKRK